MTSCLPKEPRGRNGGRHQNRPRLTRVRAIAPIVALVAALILARAEGETAGGGGAAGGSLLEIATKLFPDLTHAERALLEYADIKSVRRGEYAVCGPSANPDDASNDPQDAAKWDEQRSIRASLIRWMCVYPEANRQIDPQGVQVLGAKVIGKLDLTGVNVPYGITLRRCAIPTMMKLEWTVIPLLDLGGSYTGPIDAFGISVGIMSLNYGFHANGTVDADGSRVGDFDALNGHFKYLPNAEFTGFHPEQKPALNIINMQAKDGVWLLAGFEANGQVWLSSAKIGGTLAFSAGHFINPGNVAIEASGVEAAGIIIGAEPAGGLGSLPAGPFEADGLVDFTGARVVGGFVVDGAKFNGREGDRHGFIAEDANVKVAFIWTDVSLAEGGILDLRGAAVGAFLIDKGSWPEPGKLLIDGLTYSTIGPGLPILLSDPATRGAPTLWDLHTLLSLLRLQPPGYHPQPYRELARALRESGDEIGARRILIASEDERYRQYGWTGAILGGFLKRTIGYGHRPLLTVFWMLGVIVVGWASVAVGKRAGVMRPTWPENPPASGKTDYPELHPFLYSLDVFLPFVNLHQERYFWPDGAASGDCMIFRGRLGVRGSVVQYYLWLQIMSGWILSAIFVAGVTGLIRGD